MGAKNELPSLERTEALLREWAARQPPDRLFSDEERSALRKQLRKMETPNADGYTNPDVEDEGEDS